MGSHSERDRSRVNNTVIVIFTEHVLYGHAKLLRSCLTLCNPMDCSPPGFSVHGILQARNTGVGCHALLLEIFPSAITSV